LKIIVFTLLIVLLVVGVGLAKNYIAKKTMSEEIPEDATIEATKVVYGFLKRQSDTGSVICREWIGKYITLSDPTPCLGKNAEINGYEFSVFADGEPAGYIYVYSLYSQGITKRSPIPFFSSTGKAPSDDIIHNKLEPLIDKPIDKSKMIFFRFGLTMAFALVEKETNTELSQYGLPLTNDGKYFIFGWRNASGMTSEKFHDLVGSYQSFSENVNRVSSEQVVPPRNAEREFYYNNSKSVENGLNFGTKE